MGCSSVSPPQRGPTPHSPVKPTGGTPLTNTAGRNVHTATTSPACTGAVTEERTESITLRRSGVHRLSVRPHRVVVHRTGGALLIGKVGPRATTATSSEVSCERDPIPNIVTGSVSWKRRDVVPQQRSPTVRTLYQPQRVVQVGQPRMVPLQQ